MVGPVEAKKKFFTAIGINKHAQRTNIIHYTPTEQVKRVVQAIRLDRVDAKNLFWVMTGFTSNKAVAVLEKRGVRYVGPRPSPSSSSSLTGSTRYSSGQGITALLEMLRIRGGNVPEYYGSKFCGTYMYIYICIALGLWHLTKKRTFLRI